MPSLPWGPPTLGIHAASAQADNSPIWVLEVDIDLLGRA